MNMVFASSDSWGGIQGCSVEEYDTVEPDERGHKYITCSEVSELPSFEDYEFVERHGQEHYFVAEVRDSAVYEKGTLVTFYRVDATKDILVKTFEISSYKKKIEKHPIECSLAVSEDLETAVSQAKLFFEEQYGSASDEVEVFYQGSPDNTESYWMIKGTHFFEAIIPVPYVVFSTDGTVLATWKE